MFLFCLFVSFGGFLCICACIFKVVAKFCLTVIKCILRLKPSRSNVKKETESAPHPTTICCPPSVSLLFLNGDVPSWGAVTPPGPLTFLAFFCLSVSLPSWVFARRQRRFPAEHLAQRHRRRAPVGVQHQIYLMFVSVDSSRILIKSERWLVPSPNPCRKIIV